MVRQVIGWGLLATVGVAIFAAVTFDLGIRLAVAAFLLALVTAFAIVAGVYLVLGEEPR